MSRTLFLASSLLCFGLSSAPPVRAQAACLEYSPTFGAPATDGPIRAQVVYDDGTGPALYIGGSFTAVGHVAAPGIARFDGASWSSVGGGTNGQVHALLVQEGPDGAKLLVGGNFTTAGGATARRLASWDGEQWAEIGGGIGSGQVNALALFDDGFGPELYVGGTFGSAGGQSIAIVARWDGNVWTGVGNLFNGGSVKSLVVFDDGVETRLYAGGQFSINLFSSSGLASYHDAHWTIPGGSQMTAVFANVTDLALYDDGAGAGPRLYVAGTPTAAAGISSHVGIWDGTSWTSPGSGIAVTPDDLAVAPGLGGDTLVAAGAFTSAGGTSAQHVARWDGVQWQPFGAGIAGVGQSIGVFAGALFVGSLLAPNTVDFRLETWDGTAWSNVPGGANGVNDDVWALHVHDDGTGQALYAAGEFRKAGLQGAEHVARWNGTTWSPLGAGIGDGTGTVITMETFDAGNGPELYVGGSFVQAAGPVAQCIARWNGSDWVSMPGTPSQSQDVRALLTYDDGSGPALYVAGRFTSIGGLATSGVARWDGTSYSALGPGLPVQGSMGVLALAAFDDGSGTKLYAGGSFTNQAGVTPSNFLARWNGATWEAVPASNAQLLSVEHLTVSSVGGVARLIAGCGIHIDGGPQESLAAWDGGQWTSLGAGLVPLVGDFQNHDEGTGAGSALYVAGLFQTIGGVACSNVARWDGASWSPVGGGLAGGAFAGLGRALAAFDDGQGSGRDLYVGGNFTTAGAVGAQNLARFGGCGETGIPLCFGDGSLATACPCANTGAAGHGCANSQAPEGALLVASGLASDDSVVLSATSMLSANSCIFLQGTLLSPSGVVFGDGVRCAGGQLLRLAVKSVQSGSAIYPGVGDPSILERNVELGAPVLHPSQRVYQTYYRDSSLAFCAAGGTFNVTNGVKIVW